MFSDGAAEPLAVLLDTIPSNYHYPPKGFYWNNTSRIIIGKPKKPFPAQYSFDVRATDYPYFEEDYIVFHSINFRFFGDTKLIVRYIEKTKEIELLIEE